MTSVPFNSLPIHSSVFEVDFAPYPMGWFHLRITVDDRCVMIDHDITMIPSALGELEIAIDELSKQQFRVPLATLMHAEFQFEDESLDTAQIELHEGADGWCRLVVSDWCEPHLPPRLDVLVETERLCSEFQCAIRAFTAVDKVGPAWDARFFPKV